MRKLIWLFILAFLTTGAGAVGTSRAADPNELLGVDAMEREYPWPAATLHGWRYRRVGPPSVRLGRRVFWRRGDVEAWIASQAAEQARGRVG